MRVGNASLIIREGRERDSGHVEMVHGQQYTVELRNHFHRPADVALAIDGKVVGEWRVHANGFIVLERGVDDQGRFTFFKADSAEGDAAGAAGISKADRGLVQAVFKFQKAWVPPPPSQPSVIRPMGMRGMRGAGGQSYGTTYGGPELRAEYTCRSGGEAETKTSGMMGSTGSRCLEEGVTGLTGHSHQQFHSVAPLETDPDLDTTITVRLGVGPTVRPLQPVRGNSVPEPIG